MATATQSHATIRHEKPKNSGTSDSAVPTAMILESRGSSIHSPRSVLMKPNVVPLSDANMPASETGPHQRQPPFARAEQVCAARDQWQRAHQDRDDGGDAHVREDPE